MSARLEAWGVVGLPEVVPGDQLGDLIADACRAAPNGPLADRDVVVVTQKIGAHRATPRRPHHHRD
ncbi:MAG: hypothetical protein EBT17_05035 [Actinobacteria bacterium]|nr:hypothetical protein [Actinomycetota bacterium]